MAWRFVVTDLAGNGIGEPRAFNRSISLGVSMMAVASFRIRAEDPLWNTISAGLCMLKVYDSAQNLRLYGPIVADEEQAAGQGAVVKVTAADLAWRLAHRLVGKDTTGIGTTYTLVDSGTIAYNVLAAVNADEQTGISAGTKDTFVARTVTYLWKKAIDAISELGAVDGSYEWVLRYTDGAPPTVALDLKTKLGTDKSTSLFIEYGTGKTNCSSYTRARSIDTMATRVWVLGSGSTIVANAYDLSAEAAYKRHEDVVSYGDITVVALLDALASANVAVRDHPRVVATLQLFPQNAPRYGVDYVLGDVLGARVVVKGSTRLTGPVRVWQADIALDELGNETATLKISPDA